MSEIECLHCYETLDIPEWVNTDKYNGEIRCMKCNARLHIKFVGSIKPVEYKLVEKGKQGKVEFDVEFVDMTKGSNNQD